MKLSRRNHVPILDLEGKELVGFDSQDRDGYYDCTYVFEPSSKEFSLEDITELNGFEFIEDVCINAPFTNGSYSFVFKSQVGRLNNILHFDITAYYSSTEWEEKVNLKHFLIELEKVLENCKDYVIESYIDFASDENYFTLYSTSSLEEKVGDCLHRACQYLSRAHGAAIGRAYFEDGFISQFNFPEEYKSAFVQYLTYFARFLEDIGVKGNLTISDKEELTYLHFVPKDNTVALENIASALSTYLSLPQNDIEILPSNKDFESEIKLHQLVSVVEHLRSQLSLSKALLSVKDREIDLLDAEVKKNRAISSDIKEYWEPLEGVRITEYKGRFFEINIPKIVKGIKDNLNRKNK